MVGFTNHADKPVYAAGRRFESAVLRSDDSLFTPAAAIWSAEVLDDFYGRFVLRPDESKDTFIKKYERQLTGAPPATIQLGAEALYVTLLGPVDVGAATKQNLVRTVLSWSSAPVEAPGDLMNALDGGIASYGFALMHRPFQISFLVEFVRRWRTLPAPDQERALSDPWRLKAVVASISVKSGGTQGEALLNLLRPESFEPIIVRSHKEAVAKAFPQYVASSSEDLDRKIAQIRTSLTPEYGAGFSFYEPEIEKKWRKAPPSEASLHDAFAETLQDYCAARSDAPFVGDHPVFAKFQRVVQLLVASKPVRKNSHLTVRFSLGQGNWARVPWIAILDNRITSTTQTGFYCVFLYREDCQGLFLTLNQGVTRPQREMGPRRGREWLRERAAELRSVVRDLADSGFNLDDSIDLHTTGSLGNDYEVSTVAYKYYPSADIPSSAQLLADLDAALTAYDTAVSTTEELELAELPQVHSDFAAALRASGVIFGAGHDRVVRAFLASAMTKRFVILTGLSGSGKTQIAVKFGEWVGDDHCLVVPVHPDWTGPEPLFGYEDVLRPPSSDGRRAWVVPPALAFMLKAASDAENPYVLVLDEMNLAHVERYFADFLSGIESGLRVLPNLIPDDSGDYRVNKADPGGLEIPANLFVLGTVNVDETTYLFSPKVLDRANTLEFRVGTGDLIHPATKPTTIPPGLLRDIRAVLAVAKDADWHLPHASSQIDAFVTALRRLHRLLSRFNLEFGFRTYFEAVRFSAIYAALGEPAWEDALDLQLYQKVLPRIHGSQRKVEPLLRALAAFCMTPDGDDPDAAPPSDFDAMAIVTPARLPIALDKIQRMAAAARADHFTSFAE